MGEGPDRHGSLLSVLGTLTAVLLLVLTGCSGDGSDSGAKPGSSVTVLTEQPGAPDDVSGDYDTSVELLESTCDGIEVADNETTVEQDGDSVTLIHAGLSYVGPLRDDGSFATAGVEVTVGGDTHTLAVAGTFGDDGFDAQVVAAVTGGQTCGYSVAWTGTRQ